MEFSISPKGLEKWMHQNRAEYTGAFVEGTLLDRKSTRLNSSHAL